MCGVSKPAARPSSTPDGDVVLGECIGKGSSASVYLGIHVATKQQRAVKVCGTRLANVETSLLQQLNHPHIVALEDLQIQDENAFLVMELCAGGELFNLIIDQGCLRPKDAQRYFSQIASALAYAHDRGIAHRDLKPENVLLDSSLQNAKLADFGLSVQVSPTGDAGPAGGTLAYAAPELLIKRRADPFPADAYSLAVVLFVMLVGELPFDVASMSESLLFAEFATTNTLRLEDRLPSAALPLIKAMLSMEPEKRPRMAEVVQDDWVAVVSCESRMPDVPDSNNSASSEEVPSPTDSPRLISDPSTNFSLDGTSPDAEEHGPGSSPGKHRRCSTILEPLSSQSSICDENQEEEWRKPCKMRRIGWAVRHKDHSAIMDTLKGVFKKLEITLELESSGESSSRGYVGDGDLQLSVSSDADGIQQVEWTRMGASIFELKRVYQAVQQELDDLDGPGTWAHRYGADALDAGSNYTLTRAATLPAIDAA